MPLGDRMKKLNTQIKLPASIQVDVSKGVSGTLLAKLSRYDVFTEADSLNELFLQVNDLIYTYFDIPKKLQEKIRYIPSPASQEKLIKISEQKKSKEYAQFDVRKFYDSTIADPINYFQ